MTLEFLYDFIKQNKFAVLSTISKDNTPQSAWVGIAVTPDLKIIFDTTTDSRKYNNLLNTSNVSFVIGWENGQTIQYEGKTTLLGNNPSDEIINNYFSVFPDGVDRKNNWNNITYCIVEPCWIRFSDFNESPPSINEIFLNLPTT